MEIFDSLTGLYSKKGFSYKAQETLESDSNTSYQIVYSDVRHLKLVNDLYGIPEGDKLIQKIGKALKDSNTPGAIYARLDGDQFATLVSKENAQSIIDLLTKTEFCVDACKTYKVHIDVGVYEIEDRTVPITIMCDRAKMALNTIKEDVLKQVAYYSDTIREQMVKEQMLFGEMHRAIRDREMIIYLQGLYDSNENLVGAEALVRWAHPEKGILSAGEFVGVLENNGLIVSLDQYVWELACQQLQKWQQEGKSDLFLAVNISAKDFDTIDVCEVLIGLVNKYGINPEKLRLEITETALMTSVDNTIKVIEKLRENGFKVEIDDFGSGYSSLNMLKDIVVDVVKLDMKFLRKCKDEERSKTILQMMVDLVKKLDMQVIVEGVETKEQLEFLKSYNCDVFQGYLLMRPMDVENFERIYFNGQVT